MKKEIVFIFCFVFCFNLLAQVNELSQVKLKYDKNELLIQIFSTDSMYVNLNKEYFVKQVSVSNLFKIDDQNLNFHNDSLFIDLTQGNIFDSSGIKLVGQIAFLVRIKVKRKYIRKMRGCLLKVSLNNKTYYVTGRKTSNRLKSRKRNTPYFYILED